MSTGKTPNTKCDTLDLKTQFEGLYSQLSELKPQSDEKKTLFKVKAVNVAYQYQVAPKEKPRLLTKQHFESLNALRRNENVVLLKPDKGNGVALLNKSDYITKMNDIISDTNKFQPENLDTTHKIEKLINSKLKHMLNLSLIDMKTYIELRPRGTKMSHMYGLPKLHKPRMPMRPIVAMINSPYHKLAQWLANILKPIEDILARHALKDVFEFSELVSHFNCSNTYMVSYDVNSLFTNVPLEETIDIICQYASIVQIPPVLLKELSLLCTKNTNFTFNGKIYRQIDGVAMGSPLGPILANIFMSHLEKHGKLSAIINRTLFYKRYVDDTFVLCRNKNDAEQILADLNNVHPNIKFTMEAEANDEISFLDLRLKRLPNGSIEKTIYHKETWSGQYLNFNSYCPIQYKRGLVKTLAYRVRRLCSESVLDSELTKVKNTLIENGYPARFIDKHLKLDNADLTDKELKAEKKQVFLNLSYKGDNLSIVNVEKIKKTCGIHFSSS